MALFLLVVSYFSLLGSLEEKEKRDRGVKRKEQDRAGTRERQCLKLNKTGPYPEEVTVAKDRDKDGTVPPWSVSAHDYMC